MPKAGADPKVFGPLAEIPADKITALAQAIRFKVKNKSAKKVTIVETIIGSRNILHVVEADSTKMVIRLPAWGWSDPEGAGGRGALLSEAETLDMLTSKAPGVGAPVVLSRDDTANNEIGFPYICTKYIDGVPASKLWFDKHSKGVGSRHEKILKSLAQRLWQLSKPDIEWRKIGTLSQLKKKKPPVVGPVYEWTQAPNGAYGVKYSGPYASTDDFLREHCKPPTKTSEALVMAELLTQFQQIANVEDYPFILAHPDVSLKHVLVDKDGNVTGIVGWEMAHTVPRCVGYGIYPGWITRDWDEAKYRGPEDKHENSPEELEHCRDVYAKAYNDARYRGGKVSLRNVKLEHIRYRVWFAALNPGSRVEICRQLLWESTSDHGLKPVNYLLSGLDNGSIGADNRQWTGCIPSLQRLVLGLKDGMHRRGYGAHAWPTNGDKDRIDHDYRPKPYWSQDR